jgi:hypothetical protein
VTSRAVPVRDSVTIKALAEQVGVARAFVGGLLGAGHPCCDVAVLLASELVTNSVLHGGADGAGSAGYGDRLGKRVWVRCGSRWPSGPGVPVLVADAGSEAGGGRGMRLVDALAARWGYERGGGCSTRKS